MVPILSRMIHTPVLKAVYWEGIKTIAMLSVFSNILLLVIPIYTLQVYDRVLLSRSNDTLFFLTLGVIIALIIVGFTEVVRSHLLIRIANQFEQKLSTKVLTQMISLTSLGFNNGSQPLRDQEKIKNFIAGGQGIITLFDAPWIPVFILIVFLIHPWLSVVLLFGMTILFILTRLTESATIAHMKKANESSIQAYSKVDEILKNAQLIEAMGMKKSMIHHWFTSSGLASYYQSLSSDKASFYTSIAKFVRMGQNIVLTGVGAYLAINNEMTVGGMIAANILASKAAAPLEGLIASWKNFNSTKESLDRLNEVLLHEGNHQSTTHLPTPTGRLSIENVVFTPQKESPAVIKGISFELEAGTVLGIVGASAAGKSTLAKLIIGVYQPNSGHVRLDGADVASWDGDLLGKHIGYLPQDVTLMTGTIKQNIARFHDVSDELIIDAAIQADAHDLILRLPQGYDTPVGAGGNTLSGGQRQRIGLARAFFGNPRLVVLDEPNSSLDNDGDQALIRAIANAKANSSTVIIIAHRPIILQGADKLAVLSQGQLQLFGDYKEIAARLAAPTPTNG